MSLLILVLAGLLVLALIGIIVVLLFSQRRTLHAALAVLIGILGGMVVGITAPSAEGFADIVLKFGPLGHITAHYTRINPPDPSSLWMPAFVSVGILILAAMYFLHEEKMAGK